MALAKIFNLKKIIYRDGLFLALISYCCRIRIWLFNVAVFGRTDFNVFPDAHVIGRTYMTIGNNFSAGRGLWLHALSAYSSTGQVFEPKLIIGNRVSVSDYVHIGCNNRIIIGDDVLMGSKIYITDHNHGVYRGEYADSPDIPPTNRKLTEGESVEIGDRCWIGEFVTILPGVRIGEGCIIGSHSTVTHDIPANSIAVGSPARVVKVWHNDKRQWVKIQNE